MELGVHQAAEGALFTVLTAAPWAAVLGFGIYAHLIFPERSIAIHSVLTALLTHTSYS